MKLYRIDFSNYKSLRNETLDIDAFSTILIGRNNVGKTNILRGLETFGEKRKFDSDDFCKHADPEGAEPALTFYFNDFTESDLEKFQNLSIPFSPKKHLIIKLNGNYINNYVIRADEEEIIFEEYEVAEGPSSTEHEISQEDTEGESAPPDTPVDVAPQQQIEDTNVSTVVGASEGPQPNQQQSLWKNFIEELWGVLPRIVFFGDPPILSNQATIEELEGEDPKFDTARRLLKLAGVTEYKRLVHEDVSKLPDTKKFRNRISEKLTELFQKNWLQDTNLSIEIDYDNPNLTFTFMEATGGFTFPDLHSEATLEYIAILADILTQIENTSDSDNILLLFDEPGTRLHPGGKRDLLFLLRDLSQKHQIIYTTHSVYLMDKNFPGQIRLVRKTEKGTDIINKPHASQQPYDTWAYEPLITELGIGIGDSWVFDRKNVIVEGPADQILISGFSQILSSSRYPKCLDLADTAIVPAESVNKINKVARRAKLREARVVSLFDSDGAGVTEIKNIQEKHDKKEADSYDLDMIEVISINDAYKVAETRETEDLFPKPVYLEAVNNVYRNILNNDWEDLSAKQEPFVKSKEPIIDLVEQHFEKLSKSREDKRDISLDKVKVAKEVINILRDTDIFNDTGGVKKQFFHAAKIIEMLRAVLDGEHADRVESTAALEDLSAKENEHEEPGTNGSGK